ncbi:MAG: ABC transporter [Hirschia sp.]|nr:ABC transporter [Hirschia sp.]MBF17611.1 ABC transporter [Hirschia sp.]|tara:strand:- start:135 stop:1961 length:1827 start_codon:yes stop_codon:yes gene_type:complete
MSTSDNSVDADRKAANTRRGAAALPDRPKGRSVKPLAKLWPYVHRRPLIFWPAILLLLIGVGLTLFLPFIARNIVDGGLATGDISAINQGFMVFVGVVIAMTLVTSSRFYFMSLLGERAAADLRADVYQSLIFLSPGYFTSLRTGEAVSRLTSDVTLIESFLGSSFSIFLRNALSVIGALILMFALNWRLTGVVFVAAPLIILPLMGIGKRVRKLSTAVQDRIADAAGEASESLDAIELVQAYGQEQTRASRFRAACETAFQAARRRIGAQALMSGSIVFALFTGVALMAWLAIQEVLADRMTSGELAQFAMYAMSGISGFGMLADVANAAMRTSGAIQRCAEILDAEPDIRAPANPTPLPTPARGALTFRNVHFSYPEASGLPAINGFDLDIKPGESVALVGPSGSGKSTIFRLLLRFYDPREGAILLDGVEARDADPRDWRARFGYVPQEAALFSGDAAENVRVGNSDASDDEVRHALQQAEAWRFLEARDGLKTSIGGRGKSLSGGERQRVAIARALARNAAVMLLDEATSALDAENERLVQQALDTAAQGHTTLIIAHRLATIRKVDRIVVLEKGKVAEEGDHESLVRQGGVYAHLAELQFSSS